jgi:formylglycine-generating enzyme required for sulfatase activity
MIKIIGALFVLAGMQMGFAGESGFINPDLKWPTMPIRVCWDGHQMTEMGANNVITHRDISVEQGWVEQAIDNTWEFYGAVDFDWRYSTGPDCGIIIKLLYDIEHTVKHGKEMREYVIASAGLSPNMILDFSIEPKNLKENKPDWSTLSASKKTDFRKLWIMHAAIHEFGHALGFYHEHKRTDKDKALVGSTDPNGGPEDKEKIVSQVVTTGYYDKYSIMNYYALNRYAGEPNTILSCGDVAAIRTLYAPNPGHSYLATCCTVEKISLLGKTPDWPEKFTDKSCSQPSTTAPGGVNGNIPTDPPTNSGNSLRMSNGIPQTNTQYTNDYSMAFGWEIARETQNGVPGYRISFYVKPGSAIYTDNTMKLKAGLTSNSASSGTPYSVPPFTGGVVNPSVSSEKRSSADGTMISKTEVWIPKGAGLYDPTIGEFYTETATLPANVPWWTVTKVGNVYRIDANHKVFTIDGIGNGPFAGSLPYEPFTLASFSPFSNTSLSTSFANVPSQTVDGVLKTLPFKMAKTELTQQNYWLVMGKAPSTRTTGTTPLKPAEGMRFNEAILFCNRLSLLEGLDSVYTYTGAYFMNASSQNAGNFDGRCYKITDLEADTSKNGYRLPTPDEWSWAMKARASTKFYWGNGDMWTSTESRPYAWGWYSFPTGTPREPQEVGTVKIPNSWNLYDLVGNVAEYVWHKPATGLDKTANIGGSFVESDDALRLRNANETYSGGDIGFRIIRKGHNISLTPIMMLLLQ